MGATDAKRVAPFGPIGSALTPQLDGSLMALIEMERGPTGCLRIRMTVFARSAKPCFRLAIDHRGTIVCEDFQCCDDARRAGSRIWGDADLSHEMVHRGKRACRLAGDVSDQNVMEESTAVSPGRDTFNRILTTMA